MGERKGALFIYGRRFDGDHLGAFVKPTCCLKVYLSGFTGPKGRKMIGKFVIKGSGSIYTPFDCYYDPKLLLLHPLVAVATVSLMSV